MSYSQNFDDDFGTQSKASKILESAQRFKQKEQKSLNLKEENNNYSENQKNDKEGTLYSSQGFDDFESVQTQ